MKEGESKEQASCEGPDDSHDAFALADPRPEVGEIAEEEDLGEDDGCG